MFILNSLSVIFSNRAYSTSLPRHVPVQVLAVTGSSSGASILFHDANAMFLLHDESKLSNKLNAKFLQQSSQSQGNYSILILFFIPEIICDSVY